MHLNLYLKCPYCNTQTNKYENEVIEENELTKCKCASCKKYFTFKVEYPRIYYPQKAPCLNGGEHLYQRKFVENKATNPLCRYCGKTETQPKFKK